MIDLSKDISDISINSSEEYSQAVEMVSNRTFQYVGSHPDNHKEKNLEFRKFEKLIYEINNYFHKNLNPTNNNKLGNIFK